MQRNETESFEDYKKRRKESNDFIKARLKGFYPKIEFGLAIFPLSGHKYNVSESGQFSRIEGFDYSLKIPKKVKSEELS